MHSKIFGDALFDYKLYQEIFVTSVGVLKLNVQFRKKSLKKCFSWKFIVSYKFIVLQVLNLFIASSTSRADRYLLFNQTKHAKVLSLTSFHKISRIFLRFHK